MGAKPIFIVGLPKVEGEDNQDLLERMRYTHDAAALTMTDYHVIIHPIEGNEMKFQVFYEKDFNEVKYEELKSIILAAVNK